MSSKNANRVFLGIIVCHLLMEAMVMIVYMVSNKYLGETLITNLILSQSVIVLPALICVIFAKSDIPKYEILGFKRIKPITVLAMVGYTICIMPVSTLVNSISMLWVDNIMVESSDMILSATFPVAFVTMCIIGPFIEEFVFRGVIFNGYRQDGLKIGAVIISALLFGMMHLNFNQAPYAFVIGIAFSFIVVATGSIWSSFICHFLFNAESVVAMFALNWLFPDLYSEVSNTVVKKQDQYFAILEYSIISGITIGLAVLLVSAVAKTEGHYEELVGLFSKEEKGKKFVTPSLIIGIVLALAYMILMQYVDSAL